jgi:hypothetical protein
MLRSTKKPKPSVTLSVPEKLKPKNRSPSSQKLFTVRPLVPPAAFSDSKEIPYAIE